MAGREIIPHRGNGELQATFQVPLPSEWRFVNRGNVKRIDSYREVVQASEELWRVVIAHSRAIDELRDLGVEIECARLVRRTRLRELQLAAAKVELSGQVELEELARGLLRARRERRDGVQGQLGAHREHLVLEREKEKLDGEYELKARRERLTAYRREVGVLEALHDAGEIEKEDYEQLVEDAKDLLTQTQ